MSLTAGVVVVVTGRALDTFSADETGWLGLEAVEDAPLLLPSRSGSPSLGGSCTRRLLTVDDETGVWPEIKKHKKQVVQKKS